MGKSPTKPWFLAFFLKADVILSLSNGKKLYCFTCVQPSSTQDCEWSASISGFFGDETWKTRQLPGSAWAFRNWHGAAIDRDHPNNPQQMHVIKHPNNKNKEPMEHHHVSFFFGMFAGSSHQSDRQIATYRRSRQKKTRSSWRSSEFNLCNII